MKKDAILIIVLFVFLLGLLCGCTENENSENQNNSQEITAEKFIGEWNGEEVTNKINITVTFYSNKTGSFQSIPITWELNNSQLELGMFQGESPSFYTYQFIEGYTKLTLKNIYADEEFVLIKD
jgi:uncharacterized membrane protein